MALLLFAATTKHLCAEPISTAFAYQGRLQGAGVPTSGLYDFHFAMYGSETNNDAVAEASVVTNVFVTSGRFTVLLDFGPGTFNGQARWIEIGVRTNGESTFTKLTPRQPMLAVPYALHAANAGLLNGASNSVSVSTIISSVTIVSDQYLTNGVTAGTNGGFLVRADGSMRTTGTITAGTNAGFVVGPDGSITTTGTLTTGTNAGFVVEPDGSLASKGTLTGSAANFANGITAGTNGGFLVGPDGGVASQGTVTGNAANFANGVTAGTNAGFIVGPNGSITTMGTITAGTGSGFLVSHDGNVTVTGTMTTSGITNTGGSVTFSNQVTTFNWPANQTAGQYIDFHRGDKTTVQWIRWYDDDSQETNKVYADKPFLVMGPDIARSNMTYFVFGYDTVMDSDVLNLGNDTISRGHIGINSAPATNISFGVFDPPAGIWLDSVTNAADPCASTMYIGAQRNALRIHSGSDHADLLRLDRNEFGDGHWVAFHQGGGGYDWRLGQQPNSYDLVFRSNNGTPGIEPASPGDEILRLGVDSGVNRVSTPYYFEATNGVRLGTAGQFTVNSNGLAVMPAESEWGMKLISSNSPLPPESGSWSNDARWVGIQFVVGSEDMALRKLGRYTAYGLTNKQHTILLLSYANLYGTNIITNASLTLPKVKANVNRWVWAPIYSILNAGSTNWILTDSEGDGDYFALDYVPTIEETNVTHIWSCYTKRLDGSPPGNLTKNRNNGPINWMRDY